RPNVFIGIAGGNTITFTHVPFAATGALATTRVFTIVNVPVHAQYLAQACPGGISPAVAAFTVSSPLNPDAVQTASFIQSGLAASVRSADNSSVLASPLDLRPPPLATRVAVLRYTEAFSLAFKRRTYTPFIDPDTAPAPAPQNVPGTLYYTESGFYAPSLS